MQCVELVNVYIYMRPCAKPISHCIITTSQVAKELEKEGRKLEAAKAKKAKKDAQGAAASRGTRGKGRGRGGRHINVRRAAGAAAAKRAADSAARRMQHEDNEDDGYDDDEDASPGKKYKTEIVDLVGEESAGESQGEAEVKGRGGKGDIFKEYGKK